MYVCSARRGGFGRKLRIQGRMQVFETSVFNCVLTPPHCSRGPELLKSSRCFDLGALCVELWPIYCSNIILVPMSYISFWKYVLYVNYICITWMRKPKETLTNKKMRLDALIIFLIEWRHHVSYLGGKQSKYCNPKKHKKYMRSMYVFYDVFGYRSPNKQNISSRQFVFF